MDWKRTQPVDDDARGVLRVLHLEDDPNDTLLAQETLAAEGLACELVRVDTRTAFVGELRKGGYGLILADYTLPTFDGLTALAIARETCPDVPFVVLSGTLGEELAIDTVKNGATDYVLKQRLARLAPAVRRALREAAEHAQRRRAEEALRESEERFRATFEQSAVGIAHVTPDGRFLRVNQRFADIVGYTPQELLQSTLRGLIYPEDFPADRANAQRLLAGEIGAYSMEKRYVRKNSSLVWVSITVSAVRDARGGCDYLIGVVQDITARREAEAAQQEAEQRLSQMLENVSALAGIVSSDECVTYCNPHFLQLAGWSRDEILGRNWIEVFVPPEQRAGARAAFARGLCDGSFPPHLEGEILTRDGRRRLISWSNTPLHDAGGHVIGLAWLGYDITARKQAETALARRTQELETLMENAPDMIARVDRQFRHLLVNRSWSAVMGCTADDARGRTLRELGLAPEICDLHDRVVTQAFETRQIQEVEFDLQTASGDRRFQARIVPEPANGPAADAPTALLIARDVTEQRRLEEELNQAQKMEVIGQLAGGIAHDINNVLTAILGYAALARVALPPGHAVEQNLQQLEDAAVQAAGVVKGLLIFSHKTPTCRQPVDLRAAVEGAVRFLARLLPASVEVVVEGTDGPAMWALADSAQLQQVVMNLAVNARDAMPEGGTLRITLQDGGDRADSGGAAPEAGRFAQLVVADTGSGIPSDALPHIFEPFFTTKPLGQGTGLGLAIVQNVVERHGGSIDVRSEPGKGTTFTIHLPCIEAPAAADAGAPRAAPAQGHGELVLVVDDNVQVLDVITCGLRQIGFDALQAANVPAALAQCARYGQRIRLAVLDIDLPGGSGLHVLRTIRRSMPALPAVVITGNVDRSFHGEEDGQTRLFQKPFRLTDLLETVAELLAQPSGAETVS